ncbi:hypothetical protein B0H19DRAFT_1080324 [Mycena capillaripes]|nr:hypothetical protein B0H19DRAFT_1080324 [Mycena capillaripes]
MSAVSSKGCFAVREEFLNCNIATIGELFTFANHPFLAKISREVLEPLYQFFLLIREDFTCTPENKSKTERQVARRRARLSDLMIQHHDLVRYRCMPIPRVAWLQVVMRADASYGSEGDENSVIRAILRGKLASLYQYSEMLRRNTFDRLAQSSGAREWKDPLRGSITCLRGRRIDGSINKQFDPSFPMSYLPYHPPRSLEAVVAVDHNVVLRLECFCGTRVERHEFTNSRGGVYEFVARFATGSSTKGLSTKLYIYLNVLNISAKNVHQLNPLARFWMCTKKGATDGDEEDDQEAHEIAAPLFFCRDETVNIYTHAKIEHLIFYLGFERGTDSIYRTLMMHAASRWNAGTKRGPVATKIKRVILKAKIPKISGQPFGGASRGLIVYVQMAFSFVNGSWLQSLLYTIALDTATNLDIHPVLDSSFVWALSQARTFDFFVNHPTEGYSSNACLVFFGRINSALALANHDRPPNAPLDILLSPDILSLPHVPSWTRMKIEALRKLETGGDLWACEQALLEDELERSRELGRALEKVVTNAKLGCSPAPNGGNFL